jgi:ribosomal protein S12 methylthiotransferase accessory factor
MSWMSSELLAVQEVLHRQPLARLVQPRVGLMEGVDLLGEPTGVTDLTVASTRLGNLTAVFPHIRRPDGSNVETEALGGAALDSDPSRAWLRAVVEGAERYATMVFGEDDFIVDSAQALGARALDLERLPRCSDREYADPRCTLRPADPRAPIRWVRGYSLVSRTERFVPAVMAHLFIEPWPAERFWISITTGVAAHTDLATALASAICEGVERDAVSLTWLARLPVARIAPPAGLDSVTGSGICRHLFDVTTDVNIPTVLVVDTSAVYPRVVVGCATALAAERACVKAGREATACRMILARGVALPGMVEDFTAVAHGATYYAHGGEQLRDFEFLLATTGRTSLAEVDHRTEAPTCPEPAAELAFLVQRLRAMGMDAIAVDLTTQELREVGLWVVRVIVPELVPMSFVHRARFLGASRIYEQARRRGAGATREEDVNSGPIPMA